MNLISPGPHGPPQAQIAVGCVLVALRCAQLRCSFLPIAHISTGKVRPTWVCQHKPRSGLCVTVWTQLERWTEMPVS